MLDINSSIYPYYNEAEFVEETETSTYSSSATRSVHINNLKELLPLEDYTAKACLVNQGVPKTLDITVAIPTYNGAKRLPQLLEQLRQQVGTEEISWEIIVADNNSRDDTATLVRDYAKIWPDHSSLRYCFAAEQGAAFARQRAVEEAKGDLIAFLDDDNTPALDWIFQAYHFAQNYPEAGAFGSQIHGNFEGEVPPEFDGLASYLAIIKRGDQPHCYDPKKKILPPGAGLVVRRQAWLNHVPRHLFLNHKGKSAGLASEDLEAILHIQKAGHEVWYCPDMVVHHQIPQGRLKGEYLVALLRCVGLSSFYIRMLRASDWQRPLMVPAYIANDFRRLALHAIQQQVAPSNHSNYQLKATCERERLVSTLISPFFLLKKVSQDAWQQLTTTPSLDHDLWSARLTQAFEQDQFQLYSQSVMAVDGEGDPVLAQAEILMRIVATTETGERQLLLPRDFMKAATQLGLTQTLDHWVIRKFFASQSGQTCRVPLGDKVSLSSQRTYSLNLTAASLNSPQFADFIAEQLTRSDLRPEMLCFEIPATALAAHPDAVIQRIYELKEIGCQIVLDDCYQQSQLRQLSTKLPIDYCKISGQLLRVGNASTHHHAAQTLVGITQWGRDRSICPIIKGVESVPMLHQVRQIGIPYAQGYTLAKPQPLHP